MLVARRPSQRVIEGTIQGDASVWKTVSCRLLYTAGLCMCVVLSVALVR
jgi:hypothetical protein